MSSRTRALAFGLCVVLCAAAAAVAAPQSRPALSQELRALAGKVVSIHFDVDLDGDGEPSVMETRLLAEMLRAAGTKVRVSTSGPLPDAPKVDVIVLGEIAPENLVPADPNSPIDVYRADKWKETAKQYGQLVEAMKASAKASSTRLILAADVRAALGVTLGRAELAAEAYRSIGRHLERAIPEVRFEEVGLNDVLGFLTDVSGVPIDADWAGLEAAGIARDAPVTLKARDIPMLRAITATMEAAAPGKLAILCDGAGIRVMTKARAAQLSARLPRLWLAPDELKDPPAVEVPPDTPAARVLRKRLSDIKLDGAGLKDVTQFLGEVTGLKLTADWAALEAAGIDPDAPVTVRAPVISIGRLLREVAASAAGDKAAFYLDAAGALHLTTTDKARTAVKGQKDAFLITSGPAR